MRAAQRAADGLLRADTLAHEAQRRGIELRAPDVNASEALCTVEWVPEMGGSADGRGEAATRRADEGGSGEGVTRRADESGRGKGAAHRDRRLGLGYILGVREDEVKALVAAREEGGPFRSLADLASRAGAGRALAGPAGVGRGVRLPDRRLVRARAPHGAVAVLGVAVPGERLLEGTQLSLPLEVPDAPALRPLTPWESMIGDYATTGLTCPHPMQLLRGSLEPGTVSIGDLARLPHNTAVRLGGLVVARQRPGTAKGIVFLLLEDEFGTINLIVPPDLYEANRLTVRSEPLLMCEGRLEKLPQAGGGINVFVKGVRPLVAPTEQAAEVVALAEKRVAAAATGRGEGAQGGRAAASSLGEFRRGVAADPELRVRTTALSDGPSGLDCGPVARTLVLALAFVVLGLGTLLFAMSGGRGGSARRCTRSRAGAVASPRSRSSLRCPPPGRDRGPGGVIARSSTRPTSRTPGDRPHARTRSRTR